MINVVTAIKGDVLTITVNLKERHGPSASGKTVSIASTHGNIKLGAPYDGVSIGLNVYAKPDAEK
jgi:DUF4097 and DUF4098 domain-containing protein YvlB